MNGTLSQFDGGDAVIWDSVRFNSAVVIAITSPELTKQRLFLDCMFCTRVSYCPSWRPAKTRLKLQALEGNPLRIVDADSLQIDCKTARLTIEKIDGKTATINAWPADVPTPVDLIGELCDRYPKSFASIVAHFDGYSDALYRHLLPWSSEKPSIAAFREWVKLKRGFNMTTSGWQIPITSKFPDDLDAGGDFRRLYSEFRVEYDAGNIEDPPPWEGYAG